MIRAKKTTELDFIIDKLTNSIENVVTGDNFATNVLRISKHDLQNISKEKGWKFDWKSEITPSNDVYKLVIEQNVNIIQGLISISVKSDHIFMNLLENAPFNAGKTKIYQGIAGNLVAYACKLAFLYGFDGYVGFIAKTKLISL
ncbi:MAG: hypothetical protein LBG17_02200 [Bacteroidales bacterium]|jgi:hypothetical protein|nr:hypothetical protein [Bacteroidales bacterium]